MISISAFVNNQKFYVNLDSYAFFLKLCHYRWRSFNAFIFLSWTSLSLTYRVAILSYRVCILFHRAVILSYRVWIISYRLSCKNNVVGTVVYKAALKTSVCPSVCLSVRPFVCLSKISCTEYVFSLLGSIWLVIHTEWLLSRSV